MLGHARKLERISAPDHDICITTRLQRSNSIGDTKDFRWCERDRAQRVVPRHSIRNGVSSFLLDVAYVECLFITWTVACDDYLHAGAAEKSRILLVLTKRGEA